MPQQRYNHHLFICTNRRPDGHATGCCASKGADELRDYMRSQAKALGLAMGAGGLRINKSGCLGNCAFGPAAVIYPEGQWHQITNKADADALLQRLIDDAAGANHPK